MQQNALRILNRVGLDRRDDFIGRIVNANDDTGGPVVHFPHRSCDRFSVGASETLVGYKRIDVLGEREMAMAPIKDIPE